MSWIVELFSVGVPCAGFLSGWLLVLRFCGTYAGAVMDWSVNSCSLVISLSPRPIFMTSRVRELFTA